jgi:hypothetical protein
MTTDYTNPASDPWWLEVDTAPRCPSPSCGTRLDRTDRQCPFGPHEDDT